MNVKRVTVTSVVIQRGRRLDVNIVWEGKPCACLPRQHERVRCRNFLACLITVARRDRWIGPYRIFGVFVVIDELRGIHEEVELQFFRFSRRCDNGFTVLAVPSLAGLLNCYNSTSAKVESKCVLPLLREAFRIDVVIPQHRRGYERLRHSASGKLEVRESGITEICLTNENSIVAF